jgi:hypothetical protein
LWELANKVDERNLEKIEKAQPTAKPNALRRVPTVEDLPDPDLTPKKRGGLKRSYAMYIATPVVRGKYEQQAVNDEYEPGTERESELDVIEPTTEHDDDSTPKKKQKATKATVREAVGSSRQEPEPRQDKNKVRPISISSDALTMLV